MSRFVIPLLAVAFFFRAFGTADAGVLIQTQSSTNGIDSLVFAQFDPTLGTLQGVEISFSTNLNSSFQLELLNTSPLLPGGVVGEIRYDASFQITPPGQSPTVYPLVAAAPINELFQPLTGLLITADSPGFGDAFSIAPPLTNYEGAGQVPIAFSTSGTWGFRAQSIDSNITVSQQIIPGSPLTSITLSYTFDPATVSPVPEPGSAIFWSMGLIAVSGIGRRRKKQRPTTH